MRSVSSIAAALLLSAVGSTVHAWAPHHHAAVRRGKTLALSMTKSDSSTRRRRIHQLTEDSDVLYPDALTIEERWEVKPDEDLPFREFIFHSSGKSATGDGAPFELCRVKVQDTPQHTFDLAHIATILYLACEDPKLILQGDVLELSCETGLAGLMSSLVVGRMQQGPVPTPVENNAANSIDILPSKHKFDLPFPQGMNSLTLADDNDEALALTKRHLQEAGASTPSDQIQLRNLDWLHHPKRLGSHLGSLKMYGGILGSDLAYSYMNAKELARAVAYLLQPQIGRFVHVGPVQHDEDVKYLRHFLREGYLMRLNDDGDDGEAQRFTLRTKTYEMGLVEDEVNGGLGQEDIRLTETIETPMEAVVATHHPHYDGVNGDFFFPVETGQFDDQEADKWLLKETRRSGGRW